MGCLGPNGVKQLRVASLVQRMLSSSISILLTVTRRSIDCSIDWTVEGTNERKNKRTRPQTNARAEPLRYLRFGNKSNINALKKKTYRIRCCKSGHLACWEPIKHWYYVATVYHHTGIEHVKGHIRFRRLWIIKPHNVNNLREEQRNNFKPVIFFCVSSSMLVLF